MKYLLVSVFLILSIKHFSLAKPKTDATCQFTTNENRIYGCELRNATVTDAQDELVIGGNHVPGWNSDANVNRLNAVSSSMLHVPQAIFRRFPNLIFLHLNDVGLTDIQQRTFFNCSSLEFLDLSNNRLATIMQGVFRCKSLNEINLSGNNISRIEKDAFNGLLKLKTLHLQNNSLDMTLEPFGNLPSLQSLNLAHNSLILPREDLIHNLSLLTLDLSHNDLLDIPKDFFKHTAGTLSKLILDNNRLVLLHSSPLQELTSLRFLYLRHNELVYIHRSLFSSLVSLRELRLENNCIVAVEPYAFLSLGNVSTLDVSHNIFAAVNANPRVPLADVKQLTTLDMSFNSIFYLDVSFGLHDNVKIVNLYLNDNKIYYIHERMFEKLEKLSQLHLTNNHLITLPSDIFRHNPNLRHLMMSNNSLIRLEAAWFMHIQQLVRFDAMNNSISEIDPNFLGAITNVAILRLNSNRCINRNFPNGTEAELRFFTECFENYENSQLENITMPPIPTSPSMRQSSLATTLSEDVVVIVLTFIGFVYLL